MKGQRETKGKAHACVCGGVCKSVCAVCNVCEIKTGLGLGDEQERSGKVPLKCRLSKKTCPF